MILIHTILLKSVQSVQITIVSTILKAGNKTPCGRRLGRYRTETNKIIDQNNYSGKRRRK